MCRTIKRADLAHRHHDENGAQEPSSDGGGQGEPIASPAASRPPAQSSGTLADYLSSLSPVLSAVAPILIAAGLPDSAESLFDHLAEDELVAFLDEPEVGGALSKVARIVLLARTRDERARRLAASL